MITDHQLDFTNCKYPRHQLIINEVANSSPGPDRLTFVITTIIYSSSPPFFLAPRFWEPRDQPQPGFSLEARERALGTRLLNGDGIENSKKKTNKQKNKTLTATTIGLIMSKMSNVLTKKIYCLCFCSLCFSLPLIFTLLQSRVVQSCVRIRGSQWG